MIVVQRLATWLRTFSRTSSWLCRSSTISVPAGKKGMLWTLTYRADDRTLTDAEVDAAHARVVAALAATYTIAIR